MDMNDILNQWDKIQAKEKQQNKEKKQIQVSHKKANAPTAEEKLIESEKKFEQSLDNKNQVNPMEAWLRKYGTVDKDKLAEENVEKTKMQDKSYLLNMKPEAILDLHGLHQNEAMQRLECFVNDCVKQKFKKIMVIHGKGIHTTGTDPVLKDVVRRFIESNRHCGMSGHPKEKKDGGTGATWIILK